MKKFLNFTGNKLLKRDSFHHSQNTLVLKTEKRRFLCTISSGQDSTVTLFLLLHKDKKESLQLLYCNHFWQIKNFFSARLLYKISYFSKISYTFILPENKFLTENESREWRKKSFYRFSHVENISVLVTGHTDTDTVEKNLNTIIRGTSPGACSKPPILNYKKTVGSFFSSVTNNSFSLRNLEKTKTPSIAFCCLRSQLQTQKSIWVLLKPKKAKKNKTAFLFQNYSFDTKNKSKLRIQPLHSSFYFFTRKTHVIKKKNENLFLFSTEMLSSSFCISNDFFKLKIIFFKPLDNISRITISKFINFYNIPLISDITNFSSRFSRNKIRHQLIPFCKLLIKPNLDYLLINFFKLLSDENTSNKKRFQQLEFFYKILILQTLHEKNYFCTELNKIIEATLFSSEKRALVQKLFFDYKNINLNFFQITKLETFY